MKIHQAKTSCFLALTVLAIALLPASGQESPSDKAFARHNALWAYLRESLLVGEAKPNGNFIMLPLGIPADLGLDPSTKAGNQALNSFLDSKILGGTEGDLGNISLANSIGENYWAYVNSHTRKDPPPKDLVVKLERLQDEINEISEAAYEAKFAADNKMLDIQGKYIKGDLPENMLLSQLGFIGKQLRDNKNYRKFQQLNGDIRKVMYQMSDGLWTVRQDYAENAKFAGYPSITYPSYNNWTADDGWVKVHIGASDWKKIEEHSKTSAGFSGGYLGWKVSGKYEKVTENTDEELDNLSITFEVKRVVIGRRWLDYEAFSDSTFNLDTDAPPIGIISTGFYNKSGVWGMTDNGDGKLPWITNDLIIVRNVVLESKWDKKTFDYVKKSMSGSSGVSWGPFKVGGGGSHSWDKTTSTAQGADNKIEIKTPLIIGYLAYQVQKSPPDYVE